MAEIDTIHALLRVLLKKKAQPAAPIAPGIPRAAAAERSAEFSAAPPFAATGAEPNPTIIVPSLRSSNGIANARCATTGT
jgi:hypothetical protein